MMYTLVNLTTFIVYSISFILFTFISKSDWEIKVTYMRWNKSYLKKNWIKYLKYNYFNSKKYKEISFYELKKILSEYLMNLLKFIKF